MEVKIGRPYRFDIAKVTLDQIDALIENGIRFSLLSILEDDEYDKAEEVLKVAATTVRT